MCNVHRDTRDHDRGDGGGDRSHGHAHDDRDHAHGDGGRDRNHGHAHDGRDHDHGHGDGGRDHSHAHGDGDHAHEPSHQEVLFSSPLGTPKLPITSHPSVL